MPETATARRLGPVICCVDDSDTALEAARVAGDLCDRLGLELVLLHVAPSPTAPGVSASPGAQERLVEAEREDARALLERVAQAAGVEGRSRPRIELGSAAPCILAAAEDEGAGLVVIGSRGRGGLRSALLGSVSGTVAGKAPCPVVVVPPGAGA